MGTRFVLDKSGNRTAVIQAAGTGLETTVEYEYDALNRLVKTVDPLENETGFTYDLLGNTLTRTDANGNVTAMAYDSNGRLVSQTNAEGHTVEYEYDYAGNRTRLTDPRGNETDFAYNEFNEVIVVTYPDASFEAFSYDRIGNRILTTTRAGQAITFEYDLHNRLVKKTYPDSTETVFAYDQLGRMTGAANPTADYAFSYNDINQLLEYNLILEGEEYAVSYGWDLSGNKTAITYPGGSGYTRVYDRLNRLEQVENSDEEVLAEYAYDDLNRRTRLDYFNGTWAAYTYNEAGWLTDLVNWRDQTEVISEFAYTHDNVGNRLSMTTPDGAHNYGYDDIYQLTSAEYPAGYPFPDMTYYYDAAYNRTTTVNGGEVDYLFNNLNQYTNVGASAFGYDDNGNLTSDGTQTYYYDVENRLVRAVRNSDGQTLGEYAYDPFGRRIVKEAEGETTHYVYDHLSYQVLAEYADGGGGFSQARRFVYGVGIDEPLMMETGGGGGGRYFYHRDGLGSVANRTEESGQTAAGYRYDVYGNFQLTGSSHGNPYIFTGRRLDAETGLYFYRARHYSPGLGRFLQPDPIGYTDGLNLMSFCLNNPILLSDPQGKAVTAYFGAKWTPKSV